MFNMQKMMKQAQEMQARLEEMQEKLKDIEVDAEAGAGLVKVRINCDGKVTKVQIDDSLLSDKETLEDLMIAAMNNANTARDAKIKSETQDLMQSMGMPGDVRLPF